jgi:uncharacterized protein (DUF433 family)
VVKFATRGRKRHGNSSQCPAVESVPGRLGGAWVFRDTRMPVSAVFDNLEAGASISDIIEQFDITQEQINAVLEFAARSLDAPPGACQFSGRCLFCLTTQLRKALRDVFPATP